MSGKKSSLPDGRIPDRLPDGRPAVAWKSRWTEGTLPLWLVATAPGVDRALALSHQARLHQRGEAAELCLTRCASEAEAETIAAERGCRGTIWVTS